MDVGEDRARALDVLKRVRAANPRVSVLWLAARARSPFVQRALDAGAVGVATREQSLRSLRTAIRTVAKGERYVCAAVSAYLGDKRAHGTHAALSNRELQVLCLMASGLPPREIAAKLHVSVKTVATHRQRMRRKLGLQSSAAAIAYAIHAELVVPDS